MSMEQAIAAVLAAGFVEAGYTPTQHVRIPTVKNPVFGGIGGERRTLGGRAKYAKGDRRVTIGKRTTCFFRIGERGPEGFTNIRTTDTEKIAELAAAEAQG